MLLIYIKSYNIQFNLDYISILFLLMFSFSLFILNILAITYNKHNLLITFLCMEIIFLSIGLNFAFYSILHSKVSQVLSLYVFTVAATESAIGLAILISFYRLKQNIAFKSLANLKY